MLVVVGKLDDQIAVGVGAAQEDVPLLALVLRQREGGVFVHLHVAFQDKRFARRALPFLAPVHQHHALTKRLLEYVFVFVGFDLDADRLEINLVLGHDLASKPLTGSPPSPTIPFRL